MKNIKQKLLKIKELSERGKDGEAKAAKKQLNALLKKYNLTIDDINSEVPRDRIFKYKSKLEIKLLNQILYHYFGNESLPKIFIGESKGDKKSNVLIVKLNDIHYIDISEMYSFHKKTLNSEITKYKEKIFKAYVNKHYLFPTEEEEVSDSVVYDEVDYKELLILMRGMSDIKFKKSLGE